MIKTLLVDDEPLALDMMKSLLREHSDVAIAGAHTSASKALRAIQDLGPDLLFLDIQMPGMSGFDLISKIQAERMPHVVFATAYDSFAVDAFDVHAVDYLLKPIDPSRLAQSLQRVRDQRSAKASTAFNHRDNDRKSHMMTALDGLHGVQPKFLDQNQGTDPFENKLAIRDGQQTQLIPLEDIDWVDAAGDYMCVHAKGETHIMRCTMNKLQQRLSRGRFARIHRSTVVNLNKIVTVRSLPRGESELVLDSGARLKVSRTFKSEIGEIKRL